MGGVPVSPTPPLAMVSPYVEFAREEWARLRANHPLTLGPADIQRLAGLGERIDTAEVEEIYLPLSRLLAYYIAGATRLHGITGQFLGEKPTKTPFVIGVAGSVAVGKSTTSRLLREMLRRWPESPRVDLLTTDGFLLPNAELDARGLLHRKGFPDSYDRASLLRFLTEVKSGVARVEAPVYSHLTYDIVPGESIVVNHPDVLIVEGLNVLQAPLPDATGLSSLAVSDFFDFSVFVDADLVNIRRWYVERFLRLRQTAFANPDSYFRRYAALSDTEARATAADIWRRINEPNLIQNIQPTRGRATLVLTKDAHHRVERIGLRKL